MKSSVLIYKMVYESGGEEFHINITCLCLKPDPLFPPLLYEDKEVP